LFAIVDIETTGGQPAKDRITEIAIVLHDGENIIKEFSSLVNPYCNIPYNIIRITGITNEMVKDAPGFHEIAKEIVEITEGAVFVAHSVNFDYGFVKAAFAELGYNYQRKTLCTVRLSRSTFAGLPSYSLGNLCESLSIEITNRHRALGDAKATAILFDRILKLNAHLVADQWISAEIKKTSIPPKLNESVLKDIPEGITGVYYFYDQNGEVIYVGKSNDIRKRVFQHFAFKVKDTKKYLLMRETIADISFENTGSELLALLLESDEIKRLRPIFNHAQKRTRMIPYYGIFMRVDENGYKNLFVKRLLEGDEPLRLVDNMMSARELIYRLLNKYKLCSAKCDLHHSGGACFEYQIHKCYGACVAEETNDSYNERVNMAIETISFQNESFFIIDIGRHREEKAVVFIERGQYRGFGYIESDPKIVQEEILVSAIKKYRHNSDIQTILCGYLRKQHLKIPYKGTQSSSI